jgi:putative flavoprotein involved in K+ transport
MNDHIDTLVIGAGQSGLSVSYYLTQQGREHILLEKQRFGEAWRSGKWDSFTLVSPNWTIQLPGFSYAGDDPDGFLNREGVVQYLENYVSHFNPPIQTGVEVRSITNGTGNGFVIETQEGTILADNVVVATGAFQAPRLPDYHKQIPSQITQLHTSQYRNPQELPSSAVIVVGSGQSGCQIAEELYQHGYKVYLSTGSAGRVPRRYRGKDIFWWANVLGMLDETVEELKSLDQRFDANPQISGKDGGHALNLHQFAMDGVSLLGRIKAINGSKAFLADDLRENLAKSDHLEEEFIKGVEKYIVKNDLQLPTEDESGPSLRAGYDSPAVTELDLEALGIRTIIWAIGYIYDYSWIEMPIFDSNGYPIHQRGITTHPGLYFIGLQYLHKAKSSLLFGVGDDAAYITDHIERSV